MTVKIIIREEVFVRGLPEALSESFIRENTFRNPKIDVLERLGKWTGNEPKHIELWRQKQDWLAFPRGYWTEMQKKLDEFGITPQIEWAHPVAPEMPKLTPQGHLFEYQWNALQELMAQATGVMEAPTGSGKCLGKGTPVLMFNGEIKPVESIHHDDLLMGPGGKPRRVISTCRGIGPLYEIRPLRGDAWICNDAHILTLANTETGEIINLPVKEYITFSKWFKHCHKLIATPAMFPPLDHPLPLDPYFLGLWFGDGTHDLSKGVIGISKPDPEIKSACETIASAFGLEVHTSGRGTSITHRITAGNAGKGRRNPLLELLRELTSHNCVPQQYLVSSAKERAALLAGWLDADGHRQLSGYEICQKGVRYAESVCFLARSLGLRAVMKPKVVNNEMYWRIHINGISIEPLPLRIPRKMPRPRRINKDARRTGFSVKSVGEGEYYGFTLEPDGLFLLGDFTVTHNTNILLNLIAELCVPTLVIVHTTELLRQTVDRCKAWLGYEPGILGGGKNQIKDITIGMVQTLSRIHIPISHRLYTRFGCVIVDECHHSPALTWADVLRKLPYRYKYGFTATAWRKDKLDFVIWRMIGPITAKVYHQDVADAGRIVWPEIRFIETDYYYDIAEPSEWGAMITDLTENERRNKLIAETVTSYLGQYPGVKALILTDRIDHADTLAAMARSINPVVLTGRLTKTERSEAMEKIRAGARLTIATIHLLGEGVDVPGWSLLFLVSPFSGGPRVLQAVGRVARPAPGKDKALLLDFVDRRIQMLAGAAKARARLYRTKGE